MKDKKKRKPEITVIDNRTIIGGIIIGFLLILFIYFGTNELAIPGINDNQLFQFQSTMVKAVAIIVSISIGFLVSLYFNIKQFRFEIYERFAKLQDELVPYQQCFSQLADQLNYGTDVDPRYPTDYKQLQGDRDWWQNKDAKPFGSWFVRNLWEFGSGSWNYSDFDTRGYIMSKEHLSRLHNALQELSGTLARRKHYEPMLKDLGLPDDDDFQRIKFANESSFVRIFAMKISPENEQGNWQKLSFWENRIDEALHITGHMSRLSTFLHSYDSDLIRVPFVILMISSIFGVFIPILLMGFNFISTLEYGMTYISIIGFATCFVLLSRFMYKVLTSKSVMLI